MKKMVKSGKKYNGNRKKGNGYAAEITFRDERGKVVFQFRPCDENVENAMRASCDFVERKLGISLFKKGIVLMNPDGKPTNVPESAPQTSKQSEGTPLSVSLSAAVSQLKGVT